MVETSPIVSDKVLFEELRRTITQQEVNSNPERIRGLEEIQRRIERGSLENKAEAIELLLEMAKILGDVQPESALICDLLFLLIERDNESSKKLIGRVNKAEPNEIVCFSKIVPKLDFNRKKESIGILVDFLTHRNALEEKGANDVFTCLVQLGNESEQLAKEVAKAAFPYLDSSLSMLPAIIFAVRLCSKFGDKHVSARMLDVLKNSMKGYYGSYNIHIQQELCGYIDRVKDPNSLEPLLQLVRIQIGSNYQLAKAISSVLDANPSQIEYVFEFLFDVRRQENLVNVILNSLELTNIKIDVRKLLECIRIKWWYDYPAQSHMEQILVKNGSFSKPLLLEILRENEKFDFALRCLKRIGVTNEELLTVFPKTPMLQLYDFFYGKRTKNPQALSRMLENYEKLNEAVPGKLTMLEHLVMGLFSSLNFVTMNVDSACLKGVDVVCFYPETMTLLVVGCTTGTLKNDLANMDALLSKKEKELPSIFEICTIVPLVFSSQIESFTFCPQADLQYASQMGAVILGREEMHRILEMLNTGKGAKDVVGFLIDCKQQQESQAHSRGTHFV